MVRGDIELYTPLEPAGLCTHFVVTHRIGLVLAGRGILAAYRDWGRRVTRTGPESLRIAGIDQLLLRWTIGEHRARLHAIFRRRPRGVERRTVGGAEGVVVEARVIPEFAQPDGSLELRGQWYRHVRKHRRLHQSLVLIATVKVI